MPEENIKPKREFLATVYIVNERKVLLTFNKNVKNYIPLGGHIEENELPCECAVREAKEESGYDIQLININGLKNSKIPQNFAIGLDIIKPEHHHINLAYVGKILGGKEMEQSDEETELRWFSITDLETENLFEDVKEKALRAIKFIDENIGE